MTLAACQSRRCAESPGVLGSLVASFGWGLAGTVGDDGLGVAWA